VSVGLVNEGPSVAVASVEEPIYVRFDPEPGVTTWIYDSPASEVLFTQVAPMAPGETVIIGTFGVRPSTATQTRLGTLRVQPGDNRLSGPAEIAAVLSNIALSVRREPGIKLAGAPGSFTFEVTNSGVVDERDVVVNASTNFADPEQPFTFTVDAGSIEGYTPAASEFRWRIPSIAPGQTLRLEGNARHRYGSGTYVSAVVNNRAFEIETWDNGGYVDYGVTPLGTADLRVRSLNVTAASGSQLVIEATIENLGPQAATSSTSDPIVVSATEAGISATPVIAEATTSGWTCTLLGCSPAATLPVGARASFRFVLDNPYLDPLSHYGVSVRSVSKPDHDTSNNRALARPSP
jgi:hypothetical protein